MQCTLLLLSQQQNQLAYKVRREPDAGHLIGFSPKVIPNVLFVAEVLLCPLLLQQCMNEYKG